MDEMLKIHSNGQWELIKARPMDSDELAAFKAKRDAHLREKHGMKPATEQDKQAPERLRVGAVPMWHGAARIDRGHAAEAARADKDAEDKKEMKAKLKDKPIIKRPDAQNPMNQHQVGEHKRKFAGRLEDPDNFRKPLSPKKS